MNLSTARAIIGIQNRNLRNIKNYRVIAGGYEFRIDYEGGFASLVNIDYREVGRRNFKHFDCIGAYDCLTCNDALNECFKSINSKVKNANIELL